MDNRKMLTDYIAENYNVAKMFYESHGMEKYFLNIRKEYKYLCIFGAGIWGVAFCQWLQKNGIKVDFFCDNSEEKVGGIICDVKVISFEELLIYKKNTYVMVSVTNKQQHYNDQINEQLADFPNRMSNILKVAGYYRNDYKLSYEYCISAAQKIFCALDDEQSKEAFAELVKFKFISSAEPVTWNPLEKFYEPIQYFSKEFYKNREDAIIVDCGAYTGDSMFEYMALFQDGFQEYHCFEMDPYALSKLEQNIHALPEHVREKVYLHSCGLSNKEGKESFHLSTDTGGSSFSDHGELEVPVSLLDRQMGDKKITMIKMDIEGAELDALKGGEEAIRTNHPMLAISIYHSTEQFFKIPMWLIEHFPFYKLRLGLHTTITDDTVLYAIPDEISI